MTEQEKQTHAVNALQAWIDEHAAHQWPRFLAVQRQRMFKKKKRMKAIELHGEAYQQLKWYVDEVNLSLSDAVKILAKTALDKIWDAEREQQHAKVVLKS